MANYQIPLSYVVNVATIPATQGLKPLQLGTILILTEDAPVTPLTGDYLLTRNATNAYNYFGTESITAKMVNAIFSQNPNILNADGYVVIAPYAPDSIVTPATSGTLTTPSLTANLESILAVTDGYFKVTLNGNDEQTIASLDFTSAQSLEGVAEILNAELTGVTVTATENTLVFTSDLAGATSSVEISIGTGTGTSLYGSSYFDIENATTTQGTGAVYKSETTAEAITRIQHQIYTEGIVTTKDLGSTEAIEASNLVESMPNNILFLTDINTTTFDSDGLFYALQNNKNTRKLLYLTGATDTDKKQNAKLFACALASRGLSVNYAGSNSTITMTYKDLSGVIVDTNIDETILSKCEQYGADVYCSIEGLAKVVSFKQGGLYFDQLTNQIWLRTTVQTTVANLLFTTRTKIPQTTQGVNTIVNAVISVLNQGVINGMIAPGEWNSPDTFGVYEDFIRNIRTQGYYVYFTPIAEQSQADREARKCPVISIAVKEAGAIEHANIIIYVEA